MRDEDRKADYLKRAADARARAVSAPNFVVMDDYLDIAAAWRRLAEELDKLTDARIKVLGATVPSPYIAFKSEIPGSLRVLGRFGPSPTFALERKPASIPPVYTPTRQKRSRAKA